MKKRRLDRRRIEQGTDILLLLIWCLFLAAVTYQRSHGALAVDHFAPFLGQ